ncbi:MAG: ribbon-helix-helix protein, CopG family [Deltaproteobacteria bacterium]|nr:ribbon-helix-helix protein, CopG family [Deltaproteobacteria bacterium]
MKNTDLIGVRLSKKLKDVLQRMAEKDERSVSWIARKLIVDSLSKRGILPKEGSRPKPPKRPR